MTTAASTLPKSVALRVLEYNQVEMERLLMELITYPHSKTLCDEHGDPWTFVTRRRCRLFLMAKNQDMKKYEEIYVTSK